ncbi:MAG TPA: PASTA domain-containing protein, partial [Planctomycetes bacterium]|nr:PASTA domain-containing protein [Planctomycetota bacterium]
MERLQNLAGAKPVNSLAMALLFVFCASAVSASGLTGRTQSPAMKKFVKPIKQSTVVFSSALKGEKQCFGQIKKPLTGSGSPSTVKKSPCMCQASGNGRNFAKVEILLDDRFTLADISQLKPAPGSNVDVLDRPGRVIAQISLSRFKALVNDGVNIKLLNKFVLVEGSKSEAGIEDGGKVKIGTCSGDYVEGSNDNNVDIPEGAWDYSEICISSAPAGATVTCIDVHYEIIHPCRSDLWVDFNDENLNCEFSLWYEDGGCVPNINETETGITVCNGEPVNQCWRLWAADVYTLDTGYIDTWWIKVYYDVTPPPSNDSCASAISVTEDVPYYGSTVSATGSTESSCSYNDTLDVWNSFMPASSGLYTISTIGSSLYDTTLSVFDGCSGDELACNDDSHCEQNEDYYYQSELTMNMSAGSTYYIRVAGFNQSQGDYTLLVTSYDCSLPGAADNPYPPNGDTGVETDTSLSWNEGTGAKARKPTTKIAQTKGLSWAKLIYGTDNRLDEYQVTDPCLLSVGDSTVALIYQSDLTYNGDGTYTLLSDTLAQWYQWLDPIGTGNPLCSDEPFRNQPAPAYGSGFLVAEDIIVTAGHLACDGDCSNWAIIFGFVMLDADTPVLTIDESEIYYCNEVLGRTDGSPDWAIMRLDRPVTGHDPLPFRTSGKIPDNEPVIVIGHPYGVPRKYAAGATVRDNSGVTYFSANTDTYQGNSGSVVINAGSYEVEGILFGGNVDWADNGSCDRSNVCPDTGCPGWEDITRITTISEFLPWERYDVYFGTDNPPTQLIFSNLTTPTCDPCEPGNLQYNETYYWQVVTKSICGESVSNPVWHFTTLEPNAVVPDVVGMSVSQAETAITGVGLTVGDPCYICDEVVPVGRVINQLPVAGYSAMPGTQVNLWVSLGRTAADMNDDGGVDFADLVILAYYWMDDTCSEPNWCQGADCNRNDLVDYFDFATFACDWLELTADPNLVAHWTMDDDADNTIVLDSSGEENHGTAQQNTSDINTTGIIDDALSFNGIDDYILVEDSESLSPAQQVTVCGWFYFNDTTRNTGLIWKHSYNYALWTASDTVRFAVWNESAEGSTADFATSNLSPGRNFIAGVFVGTNSKLYLNGPETGSVGASLEGLIRDNAGDLYIGYRPG